MLNIQKVLLIILDGFGISAKIEHNAIANANLPTWQQLWQTAPHALLEASGLAVGLPEGQMGNSEVGHLTIGAGRVLYQDLTRIDQAIATKALDHHPVLQEALANAKARNSAVHFIGLLSDGGVHSHEQHLYALLEQCQQQALTQVYIHAFLDGRDVPPESAAKSLAKLEQTCARLGCGQIASLCGRYYAMDRDQRWERIEAAYTLLTEAKSEFQAPSASLGLENAYSRGETDEFVKPTLIGTPQPINDDDVVIFWNYRSDRARELTRAFLEPEFLGFTRHKVPALSSFISLTQYASDIESQVLFPPATVKNTLGAYLADLQIEQCRIAETEKYAHVTFFFNGGVEAVLPGEERCLIPSAKVATYDLQPAMSALEITHALDNALKQQRFGLIVCNYANPDMLGHTGDFKATQQSLEVLDRCLADVLQTAKTEGYEVILTADHGNAECMYDEATQQPHTAHTTDPVPLVYLGRPATLTQKTGTLADIAPSVLRVMGLAIPAEMTGTALINPFNLKDTL